MREEISKDKGGFEVKSFIVVMRNFVSLAVPQVSLIESGHQESSGQPLLGIYFLGSSKSILFYYGCLLINSALRGKISTVNQSTNLF